MAVNPGPHDLDQTRVVLAPSGRATLKDDSPTFYQELDADFENFSGHLLFSRHSFSEPWPTWEIHPEGDEFVYLLSGDTDFVLHTESGEQVVRVNEPGSYVIVPQGTWHTARPHAPTTMLFVTPGEGTLNSETPG